MQLHSSPLLQCHEAIREGDVQILIRALLISPYSRNYWHGVYARKSSTLEPFILQQVNYQSLRLSLLRVLGKLCTLMFLCVTVHLPVRSLVSGDVEIIKWCSSMLRLSLQMNGTRSCGPAALAAVHCRRQRRIWNILIQVETLLIGAVLNVSGCVNNPVCMTGCAVRWHVSTSTFAARDQQAAITQL